MEDNRLELGEERPIDGSRGCDFGLENRRVCDRLAVQHFKWKNGGVSGACADHVSYIRGRDSSLIYEDEHEFGGDCNMPGAVWHFSENGEEGRCEHPLSKEMKELSLSLTEDRDLVVVGG